MLGGLAARRERVGTVSRPRPRFLEMRPTVGNVIKLSSPPLCRKRHSGADIGEVWPKAHDKTAEVTPPEKSIF